MKKNAKSITISRGDISIEILPEDTLSWKQAMIFESLYNEDLTINEIANKYGYAREYYYQVLKKYKEKGSKGLEDKTTGPKTHYKRTDEIKKQIIRLRFLDPEANCEVIAQKMKQMGYDVSQRSVERTVGEYGLQKKGYIKQIRKKTAMKLKLKKQNATTPK
jgi:transposase